MKKKLLKKVNVSPKRQITIPKEIFDRMEICHNKVQVYLEGRRMVVEPVASNDELFDFTEQILLKLQKEGYKGKKLAEKLAEQKHMVEKALGQMIKEAQEEYKNGKTTTHKEVFADNEKN